MIVQKLRYWQSNVVVFRLILLLFCFMMAEARNVQPSIQAKREVPNSNTTITDPFNDANTLPLESIMMDLGVRPVSKLPRSIRRFTWRLHGRLLPWLHWNDDIFKVSHPKDKDCNALKVLWCKAISATDSKSPVYEHNDQRWTYDLLPTCSRWWLRIIPKFPRMFHANIELRTAYLNRILEKEIERLRCGTTKKIRIVCLGAGYDIRYTKLLSTDVIDEAWELDQPDVLETKQKLLQRLVQRREAIQKNSTTRIPKLLPVDLNDVEGSVKQQLETILGPARKKSFFSLIGSGGGGEGKLKASHDRDDWHTIFLSEGVFLYLNEGVAGELLSLCAKMTNDASFCFADRLENCADNTRQQVERELSTHGDWKLVEYCPKPGGTRHMGLARLL